jgi:hypothetical protein
MAMILFLILLLVIKNMIMIYYCDDVQDSLIEDVAVDFLPQ